MAEKTEIAWCDSTFNAWWGCVAISPGCENCYAEATDKRFGGNHWGKNSSPRAMSSEYWKKPIRWNKKAIKLNRRHKVFTGSMCDIMGNMAPAGQRDRLWDLIQTTPMLDWQLLTKRAPNIKKFLPDNWGDGFSNVWLGVSVENRKHGLPRIEHLRRVPAKIRFLSLEPLLEPLGDIDLTGIHWVIVGGESGPYARPMDMAWVIDIRRQCEAQGVPFFFKQWGGNRNKGGCLLNGVEIKQWPLAA